MSETLDRGAAESAERPAERQPPAPTRFLAGVSLPGGWETWLPIAIACISILGSVVSWRAANTAVAASDLDGDARRIEVERAEQQYVAYTAIDHDRGLFPSYVELSRSSEILQAHALQNPSDVDLAFRAQSEAQRARQLRAYFLAVQPDPGSPVFDFGHVSKFYDRQPAITAAENAAERQRDEADHKRAETVSLVKIVVVLLVSLFVLTVARFSRPTRRWILTAVGLTIALVGAAMFGVLELFG